MARACRLVRADQDVAAWGVELREFLDFVFGQVGPVGDPDRAVFQRVDGVEVAQRGVVDAAVLPGRVVVAAHGRALLVVDVFGDVLPGQSGVLLEPFDVAVAVVEVEEVADSSRHQADRRDDRGDLGDLAVPGFALPPCTHF